MKNHLRFFTRCIVWLFAAAAAAGGAEKSMPLKLEQGEGQLQILRGQKPALEYQIQPAPAKPYVQRLFTPGGVQILRDHVPDHKHHHGLMFALKADGLDFWSENPDCGRQRPGRLREFPPAVHDGLSRAGFEQTLNWTGPMSDRPVLREARRLEVYAAADLGATLMTWRSQLAASSGKAAVELSGDHFFGLGMRFVPSMDRSGEFFFSDKAKSEPVRGSERLTSARWCAYRSAVDGRPVTVALFDHPRNPRHPNRFFTMRPFAYLAATLNLWKEPLRIEAGKSLTLRYGVALWDGRPAASAIEQLYQRWLKITGEEEKIQHNCQVAGGC
ncbi:MAG: PmoA family protein [Pirellulales bacterium]|nr:PmoA family protein [Pirellulales bacterium]